MLKPGDEIDIWVVERALGQGGMGSVYRCHNREARRILAAIKVLDSSVSRVPSAKARFVREAEILFRLEHPGIVKVRNVRMEIDTPYLEMEFVDGKGLNEKIEAGPTPFAEALPLFRQVADALTYLHAQGVRHRDLKPSNMLVQGNGVVKLVDFGIASEADGSTITEQGQTFGSVSYAPPEWLDPVRLDAAKWDVYSAGVVFWEVLTGRQAFPMTGLGTLSQQVVRMIAVKQRHPPLDPGPEVPADLRALIREMTDPYPENRVATAEAVRARLDTIDPSVFDGAPAPNAPAAETVYEEQAPAHRPANATMIPDVRYEEAEETWNELTREPPAPPPPEPPPPPPARSSGRLGLALGALIVGGGAVALASLTLVPPAERDVVVAITGLGPETPVALRLDEALATGTRFSGVPAGTHQLVASVGEGCTATAEDPPWCARTELTVTVERSREPMVVPMALAPPPSRSVVVRTSGVAADAAVVARVDDGEPVAGTGEALTLSVSPGRHRVTVATGGCTGTDCPSWSGDLEVPIGTDPLPFPVALPVIATPTTSPRVATPKKGRVVTNAAFAAWLADHPDWAPEAAVAAGRAGSGYLAGWSGVTPPDGKASSPVVNVTWSAASAYCAGRGGLPGVDDAPTTWTDGPSEPWLQWRDGGGKPAWRRSDGTVSTYAVPRTELSAATGFRCRG